MQYFRQGKRNDLEFLPDSAEQIARSIDMTGLRDKIGQDFEAAIARARGHPQSSSEPAINEDSEIDSGERPFLEIGRTTNAMVTILETLAGGQRGALWLK